MNRLIYFIYGNRTAESSRAVPRGPKIENQESLLQTGHSSNRPIRGNQSGERTIASVRHAITNPSPNNAAASRNGAPGIFTGAWSLMK